VPLTETSPLHAGPRVCSECGAAAKYTCPGCQAQTCSLPCAKGAVLKLCACQRRVLVQELHTCHQQMCKGLIHHFIGHKETTGCTGKRNRAAYVPLDEYSERHLASDFRLLEVRGSQ
jgi:HIT zinc finger